MKFISKGFGFCIIYKMKILLIFTIFFLKQSFSEMKVPLPKPAYFDIQLDRFEQLYANLSICDFSGLKVRKVNKIRSLIGKLIISEPMDRDILFVTKTYKKQGNEYRLLPYRIPSQPVCEALQNDGKISSLNSNQLYTE